MRLWALNRQLETQNKVGQYAAAITKLIVSGGWPERQQKELVGPQLHSWEHAEYNATHCVATFIRAHLSEDTALAYLEKIAIKLGSTEELASADLGPNREAWKRDLIDRVLELKREQ